MGWHFFQKSISRLGMDKKFGLQRTIIIGLSPRRQCHQWWQYQICQHSIFKMLNGFERYNQTKCLIYDEMVKILPIFCLISPVYFAYIKQRWRFEGAKLVLIGMFARWREWGTAPDTCHKCDPLSLNDAILQHRSWSTLANVLASCLTAPSHGIIWTNVISNSV